MCRTLPACILVLLAPMLPIPVRSQDRPPSKESRPQSAAYEWLDVALEATAREHDRNGPRPTVGSRMLGLVTMAIFDAWAAYDEKAVGTHRDRSLRRPQDERTPNNRGIAIGYATYRVLLYLFPEDEKWIEAEVRKRKLDPAFDFTDPSVAAGVGNLVAAKLVAARRRDGSNHHGDEVGSNGKAYSDWTYYKCVNAPEKVVDPDRWHPIPFSDGKGGTILVDFLTPHWYRVKPFALERSDRFRPGPPPKWNSERMRQEVDEVIRLNASLNPEQKAIVEFMRDGPRSTGQSGHWLRFAQDVSRRDRYGLDEDVKIFLAVGTVAMDTFIACWEAKRHYDSSRPWTLVRVLHAGKTVKGWAGPGQGVKEIPAEKWHPYSPATFVTPPFPGFPSGHSAVSGACSRMLELITGSDKFGTTELRVAGSLTEPGFACELMQAFQGKPAEGGKLTCDVALKLPTFSATAEMAGISRIMGGYHIQTDNVEGLKMGRRVAEHNWPIVKSYFDGTVGTK